MISYKPLFHALLDRDVNLSDLANAGLAPRVIAKFRKNQHINTSTLEKICLFLGCQVQDVIEILPEPEQEQAHD